MAEFDPKNAESSNYKQMEDQVPRIFYNNCTQNTGSRVDACL